MPTDFEQRCRTLVESLGLCASSEIVEMRPLTGGVASDIGAIRFGDRQICVKFALAKLKVAQDWFAPVHRGKAEYAWLEAVSEIVPEAVPHLYGWSDSANGFAMEYIAGNGVYLWKAALLQGAPDQGEAKQVAAVLGRIHAASTEAAFDRTPFGNMADFNELRIDPYLRFTATRHPDLAGRLNELADALAQSDAALVHGDVSPKNILFRGGRPVILDAECATMGDPAFDVAFCMNHLLLKSVHLPESRSSLRAAALRFWQTYAQAVTWEPVAAIERRVAALLPALMLARVDGKSPVEYLSRAGQDGVRALSAPLVATPPASIAALLEALNKRDAK